MHLPNLNEARIRSDKKPNIIKSSNIKSDKFKNKFFYLKTYGCQMNVHDSEEIKGILVNLGLKETDNLEQAHVIILNTCAIRENAHDKVFGFLGRVKHLKREHPDLIVGIGGCMPEEESVTNLLKEKYPFVNIVFGTHNINNLGQLLLNASKKQEIEVYSVEGNVYEGMDYIRDSKYTAWVNIMYGCDKFCTYCIVPFTRGKERSRKLENILQEIQELKNENYQEVTLLGQNVNAYGKDLNLGYDFAKLLEETAKIGIPRIRFVTSHPWNFTDEMIDIIAKYDNIMPYIHLPLQSGSDNILKLMGRRYTKKEYLELFHKIKNKIPGVSITTDIIVGFPNETDSDFLETMKVVDECKFDSAFTFIYSPREGTPAALIKDNIDIDTKNKRLQLLNNKINEYSLINNKKYLNKQVKVLVIEESSKGSGMVAGYTETMKLVNIKGTKEDIGSIIDVLITDAKSFSLDGEKVIKVNN